jgi:hypothetical protein
MGKQTTCGPFDLPLRVENAKARGRTIALRRGDGVRLPTLAELTDTRAIPTLVEQQGVAPADSDRRRKQDFWRHQQDLVPRQDEMIAVSDHDASLTVTA